MATKKRKTKTSGDTLADLAELASKLGVPEDAFDGDLRDSADDEADMIFSNLKNDVTLRKLEFLYSHGYQLGRIREIIQEAATATKRD